MPAPRSYPAVLDPARVGTYPAVVFAGGGFVWDEVLEYRVWCHPASGADDFYVAFATVDLANAFAARARAGTERAITEPLAEVEEPLALVLQRQYIDEPTPGHYVHLKKRRIAEWPLAFLDRPRRTRHTIPDFFAPDAPRNRLAILRGTAPNPRDRSARPAPRTARRRVPSSPRARGRTSKPG